MAAADAGARASACRGRSRRRSTAPTPTARSSVSEDGGTRWKDVGSVGGEPYELHATGPKALFLVLSDGSILETTDGGATWRDRFRP